MLARGQQWVTGNRAVHAAANMAEIKKRVTPHTLRHSFATAAGRSFRIRLALAARHPHRATEALD
jgi:integrase